MALLPLNVYCILQMLTSNKVKNNAWTSQMENIKIKFTIHSASKAGEALFRYRKTRPDTNYGSDPKLCLAKCQHKHKPNKIK